MRTAADEVDVASDRRRRENVPRHILCSIMPGSKVFHPHELAHKWTKALFNQYF